MIKRTEWIDSLQKVLEVFIKTYPENGDKIKEEYVQKVQEISSMAASAAKKAAGCLNNQACILLAELERIAARKPTTEEIKCLLANLAGTFYWVDRQLANMAKQAGIQQATYRPTIDVSLKHIKEIENKAIDFIEKYTPEKNLDSVMVEVRKIAEKL